QLFRREFPGIRDLALDKEPGHTALLSNPGDERNISPQRHRAHRENAEISARSAFSVSLR
ncbi:MAG TPA: hypothetical protein VFO63_10890, partial [Blastocatellia bacterium]|nr:hypothetical protein [Blastocatellia bacterium]